MVHFLNPEHLPNAQMLTEQSNIDFLSLEIHWVGQYNQVYWKDKKSQHVTHCCVSSSQQKLGSCHSSSETGQLHITHFVRLPVKQTITGYLWDRPSSSQTGLRAGQRKLLQQTHHWSRKNWQRWLCTMCCQLKTTGWRQKRKINQSKTGSAIVGGGWHTFRMIKPFLSPLSISFNQSSVTETNAAFQTLDGKKPNV